MGRRRAAPDPRLPGAYLADALVVGRLQQTDQPIAKQRVIVRDQNSHRFNSL